MIIKKTVVVTRTVDFEIDTDGFTPEEITESLLHSLARSIVMHHTSLPSAWTDKGYLLFVEPAFFTQDTRTSGTYKITDVIASVD